MTPKEDRKSRKVYVPPLKIQGIKTKLIPFILDNIKREEGGTWIEPFLGSGSVLFNIAPQRAVVSDINPHIISFYEKIYEGEITSSDVRFHLEKEGAKLRATGPGAKESYYYEVRERFNEESCSLDFLFLN